MKTNKTKMVSDRELTVMAWQFTPIAIIVILFTIALVSITKDVINGEKPFVTEEIVSFQSFDNTSGNTYQWN